MYKRGPRQQSSFFSKRRLQAGPKSGGKGGSSRAELKEKEQANLANGQCAQSKEAWIIKWREMPLFPQRKPSIHVAKVLVYKYSPLYLLLPSHFGSGHSHLTVTQGASRGMCMV